MTNNCSRNMQLKKHDIFAYGKKDNYKISNWSKVAVENVSHAGIMVSDEKGNFNPKANLTREEAAAIVERILKKL